LRSAVLRARSVSTFSVGATGPVDAVDPAASRYHSEAEALANVFERLFQSDAHGTPSPLLCERWRELDGGRRYELVLRPEVCRHDGVPLTAAHVKESLERTARVSAASLPAALSAVAGVSAFLGGASDISGIRVTAERALQLELLEPLRIFPTFLT